ncbi:Transcriptional regulator, TrmB family [Methanosarcina siciliae C2J]|uniref:Transcriptional regulator, TrmB family n=1 Tax=Methanosarcina siciliae C2J TaxID=1434118 RepID=A0A0E3PL30_9EURY|nr:TrmB family transcriptional regulator [Methanosarcina siciliae]AKB35793.1 Transcriptional regulator, TrmB family [Methanosarcina siciliae C2J]
MPNERFLQDIGLNAYEAAAYLSLLKLGVSEASTIYRDSEVPYGKIYSVLESLTGKGVVEVQASRPKKYRAVDPEISLDAIFERRKAEVEREIAVLKGSVEEAKQILKTIPNQKRKDEIFWTTAITESEIKKFAVSVYSEVKKSVCIIPPVFGISIVFHALPEITKAIDRGVHIRLLAPPRFKALTSILSNQEEEVLEKLKKSLDIRLAQNFHSCFGIVDDTTVVLFQPHPTDRDRVLSVVKIRDTGFAKNLKEEFELLWNTGEKLDLQEELERTENPGNFYPGKSPFEIN